MKHKAITAFFAIAISMCLPGCKYSNGGGSSSINDLVSSINPAISQMQNNLANTYWNASLSSVKAGDFFYALMFGEATPYMLIASINGMKDDPTKWADIASTLSLFDFFISNNSLSFYYTDDDGDRHIFLTSDYFTFTPDGAEAVFNIQENSSLELEFTYYNDTQAQIDWRKGQEGTGPYEYKRKI